MIDGTTKGAALIVAGVALTVLTAWAGRCWGERLCAMMLVIEGGASWLENSTDFEVQWMHWLAIGVGLVGAGVLWINRESPPLQ